MMALFYCRLSKFVDKKILKIIAQIKKAVKKGREREEASKTSQSDIKKKDIDRKENRFKIKLHWSV